MTPLASSFRSLLTKSRKTFLYFLVSLGFVVSVGSEETESPRSRKIRTERIEVDVVAGQDAVRPGDVVHLAVRIRMASGMHVYSHDNDDPVIIPLVVLPGTSPHYRAGRPVYPDKEETKEGSLGDIRYRKHDHPVHVRLPVRISKRIEPGQPLEIILGIRYAVCDDSRCYDIVLKKEGRPISIVLPVRVAGAAVKRLYPELFDRREGEKSKSGGG